MSGDAPSTAVTRFCILLVIPEYERYYQEICAAA
jgi:hypothetical protein